MGKYEPLRKFLETSNSDAMDVSFTQLERILGFPLPNSAYRHQAWWANETHGSHSHSRSWQDAGWETRQVNTNRKTVRFERSRSPRQTALAKPATPLSPNAELWKKAGDILGIEDRTELERAVLTAFIQHETANYVASLGGSMPNAEAAPRRRFSW
jgi:hypothetical protein